MSRNLICNGINSNRKKCLQLDKNNDNIKNLIKTWSFQTEMAMRFCKTETDLHQ